MADALVRAGATVGRRSLLLSLDLPRRNGGAALPPCPHGITVQRMAAEPERHAGALVRAFPPEHPDHDPDIADHPGGIRALESYYDGSIMGPYLPDASAEAVNDRGVVAGGLVVSRTPPGESHPGGPWVTDVFVEPAFQGRGVGAALFAHTIAALTASGEPSLWLAVQVDNPARSLYLRLGFQVRSRWTRFTL